MAPLTEHLYKRQGGPGDANNGNTFPQNYFYWREWAVFVAIICSVAFLVTVARTHGRRRLSQGKPLMAYHKWLFPAYLRQQSSNNNNLTGYAMTVSDPYAQYPYTAHGVPAPVSSGRVSSRHGGGGGIAPVPPAYDPYAQNLPAYEAVSKTGGEHGSTVVSSQPVQPPTAAAPATTR